MDTTQFPLALMIRSIFKQQSLMQGRMPSRILASAQQLDAWSAEASSMMTERVRERGTLQQLVGVTVEEFDCPVPLIAWEP